MYASLLNSLIIYSLASLLFRPFIYLIYYTYFSFLSFLPLFVPIETDTEWNSFCRTEVFGLFCFPIYKNYYMKCILSCNNLSEWGTYERFKYVSMSHNACMSWAQSRKDICLFIYSIVWLLDLTTNMRRYRSKLYEYSSKTNW